MQPPPHSVLRELAAAGLISSHQAELQSRLPLAEDITVESRFRRPYGQSAARRHLSGHRPIAAKTHRTACLCATDPVGRGRRPRHPGGRRRIVPAWGRLRAHRIDQPGGDRVGPVEPGACHAGGGRHCRCGDGSGRRHVRTRCAGAGACDVAPRFTSRLNGFTTSIGVTPAWRMSPVKTGNGWNSRSSPAAPRMPGERPATRLPGSIRRLPTVPSPTETTDGPCVSPLSLPGRPMGPYRIARAARRLPDLVRSSDGCLQRLVRGSCLERWRNRSVGQIGLNILEGACRSLRVRQLRQAGIVVPAEVARYEPRRLTNQAVPISSPAANTSEPPSTT